MTHLLFALILATGPECLVLEGFGIRTETRDAELSIRNRCGTDAYAVAAELEWRLADGSVKSEPVTIDAWMSVAASRAMQVEPRWFVANAAHKRLQRWPESGAAPVSLALKPVAVELAGGRVLGEAERLTDVLAARERSKQAWAVWEKRLAAPIAEKRPLPAILRTLGSVRAVATPEDMAREELRRMVEQLNKAVLKGASDEGRVRAMLREYIGLRAGR